MSDHTKIHFSDGQELVVEQPPRQVVDAIGKGSALIKFTKRNGHDVYVSGGQITHIEQVPDGRRKPAAGKPKAPGRLPRP